MGTHEEGRAKQNKIIYQIWDWGRERCTEKNNPSRQIDGAKIPKIINLPISHCTNQHGTPRPGEGNYRRCYPVAYGEYCINNRQADVAVACERGIVLVDAVQDGFLCERDEAINEKKNCAFTIDAHGVDVLLIATIAHKIGAINYILLFNDLEARAGKVHLHKLAGRIIADYLLWLVD